MAFTLPTEKGLNYGTVGGRLLQAKALTFSIDFLMSVSTYSLFVAIFLYNFMFGVGHGDDV